MNVVGLISGTSADGVDAVLVEISGKGIQSQVKLLAFESYAYSKELRRQLMKVASGGGNGEEICHLNFWVGEVFSRAVLKVAQKAGISLEKVELVGSHGQTIAHRPYPIREAGFKIRSTLQIGEPSVIAERTGVTTVADFRTRDVAAGGQGAPLTPYLHYILFQDSHKSRLVINVGGISNITYLRAGRGPRDLLAFDTGPGNMLIDGTVACWTKGKEEMDKGGQLAARGKVHEVLLRELMRHPYLRKQPPKTTGREEFGKGLVERVFKLSRRYRLKKEHLMATVTAFTVQSIAYGFKRYVLSKGPVDQIVVGGGGTRNSTLMKWLREALAPAPVLTFEDFRLESRAVEAMAFALMAYQTIVAEPNNLPAATGAPHPVIMGKIIPGKKWPYDLGENIIEKLWKILFCAGEVFWSPS